MNDTMTYPAGSISGGVKVYRTSLILSFIGSLIAVVPVIGLLGSLLSFAAGLGQFVGMVMVMANAPPRAAFGSRFGAMLGSALAAFFCLYNAISRSWFGYSWNTPLLVLATVFLIAAIASLYLFWMHAADLLGLWQALERIRIALVFSCLSVAVTLFTIAIDQAGFGRVLGLCFGLPSAWLLLSALGEIQQTAEYGS